MKILNCTGLDDTYGRSEVSTPGKSFVDDEEEEEDDSIGTIEAVATVLILIITTTVVVWLIIQNLPETGVKKIYA